MSKSLSEYVKTWLDRDDQRFNLTKAEAEDGSPTQVLNLRIEVDSDGDVWVETDVQCRIYTDAGVAARLTAYKLKRAIKRAVQKAKK